MCAWRFCMYVTAALKEVVVSDRCVPRQKDHVQDTDFLRSNNDKYTTLVCLSVFFHLGLEKTEIYISIFLPCCCVISLSSYCTLFGHLVGGLKLSCCPSESEQTTIGGVKYIENNACTYVPTPSPPLHGARALVSLPQDWTAPWARRRHTWRRGP